MVAIRSVASDSDFDAVVAPPPIPSPLHRPSVSARPPPSICIVQFFATWCQPCVRTHLVLQQLAEQFQTVPVVKADIDRVPKTVDRVGVGEVPCFVLFEAGREVRRVGGDVTQLVAMMEDASRRIHLFQETSIATTLSRL